MSANDVKANDAAASDRQNLDRINQNLEAQLAELKQLSRDRGAPGGPTVEQRLAELRGCLDVILDAVQAHGDELRHLRHEIEAAAQFGQARRAYG